MPPPCVELHAVADASRRILRRLADAPDGLTLDQLLPDAATTDAATTTTATTATASVAAAILPGGEAPPPRATLREGSA